jgi:hypothetical protein
VFGNTTIFKMGMFPNTALIIRAMFPNTTHYDGLLKNPPNY